MSIPNLASLFQLSPQGGLFSSSLSTGSAEGGGDQGLFGSIFGALLGSEGSLNLEEGLLLGQEEGLNPLAALIARSDFLQDLDLPLEELEGAVVEITQIITVVYEEVTVLSTNGFNLEDLTDIESLSAAYEQLGLSPEDAKQKATQLALFALVLENHIYGLQLASANEGAIRLLNSGIGQSTAFHQESLQVQIQESVRIFTEAGVASSLALRDALQLPTSSQGLSQEIAQIATTQNQGVSGLFSEEGLLADVPNTQNTESIINKDLAGVVGNGRLSDLFAELADKLEATPKGEKIAEKLNQISAFVQKLSQTLQEDGGQGLREALTGQKLGQPQVQTVALPVKESAVAEVQKEAQLLGDKIKTEVTEASLAVDEPEEASQSAHEKKGAQNAPVRDASLATSSTQTQNTGFERSNGFSGGNVQNLPPLTEPAQVSYVVRPAASGGGVEIVDPETGEVIQTSYAASPAQNNIENSQNAQNAAPAATVYQQRTVRQIQVHVRNLASHGGGQIIVGLNPPELGRVQVRLEIVEGHVKGSITVQRTDVAEALARDLRALETAFQDLGLELSQDGIAIQLENNASQQENAQSDTSGAQSGTGFANNHTNGDVEGGSIEDAPQVWQDPNRLLDIHA